MDYQPDFTVSAKAISMVAEISALIERYSITQKAAESLKLRRANKIKTIQSSLAIEGNTLSVKQMTDILDGKRVIAPLREIQEVKNAIAAYDLFAELDPYSIRDLLKAHKVMMTALIDEPGKFRSGGEFLKCAEQVRYSGDADPADHWHCKLKKRKQPRNSAHSAPFHCGLVKSVGEGYRKGVHSQSDTKHYTCEKESEIKRHLKLRSAALRHSF